MQNRIEPPMYSQGFDRNGGLVAMPRSPAEALEPTRGPRRPRGRRQRRGARKLGPVLRAINGLLTLAAVSLLILGTGVFVFVSEVERPGPLQETKTVIIPERQGARKIAQRLQSEGVIRSHHVFVMHYLLRSLGRWVGKPRVHLKAGEYRFEPGQSLRSVAHVVSRGRSILIQITIPEGLTSWQIVERLRANPQLAGEIEVVPPEGALMPDTYSVRRNWERAEVVNTMLRQQRRFLQRAWEQRQSDLPYKTPEEAVVMASIIEKETGRRAERAKVAAVFINRLRRGMKLQSDPTIIYGLQTGQARWGKPITRSDIRSQTAYNTYHIPALPPTPICNPGRAAIQAALNPAQSKDLYFVADGTGGHVFSQTLAQHNAAVAKWRKIEREIRARQAAQRALEAAREAAAKAAVELPSNDSAAAAPSSPVTTISAFPAPTRKPTRAKRGRRSSNVGLRATRTQ